MRPLFSAYHGKRSSTAHDVDTRHIGCSEGQLRGSNRLLFAFACMLSLALLLLGAAALAPTIAAAETSLMASQAETADGEVRWTYTIDSSGDATITSYTLDDGITKIGIPETIDGHRVGGLADELFSGDTRLVEVTFPSTVVRLGDNLFKDCTNLEYADLTAVEELGEIPVFCFQGCTELTSVDIPASVITIKGAAFDGCTNLKQVNIPPAAKLDSIGIYSFRNCESLESLDFPASLQSIGLYTFENCKSVASIRFRGSSIRIINGCAFKGCSALEELYLPDHVREIYREAFAYCTSLKVVAFGKELPQVLIPNLFNGCDKIELMIFPMEKDGQGVYQELPDEDKQKAGWNKGVTPTVNVFYNDDDNALIGLIHATSKHQVISLPAKVGNHDIVMITDWAARGETALTELVFPEDCKIGTIESQVFQNCTSLQSITIPASVEHIDNGAFEGCTSLSSITFNTQKLASLGGVTFKGCTSLESITLPEGMTTLYAGEFYNCTKLKDVYLPDTMKDIAIDAFACDKGKHMAIGTMRMPNSNGDFNPPSDRDFFESWIVNSALDTFKFEVTYGSTADYIWLEGHMNYKDPEHYPIVLNEYNREYVPVAIGDDETHLQEANDVKLSWDTVENWTGEVIIPEVTATRWLRTNPIGGNNLTVEPAQKDDGTYYDCKSVGTQKIKVTGNAPYFTGYRILEYEIVRSNVDDVQMGKIEPECFWDNAEWNPDPDFYVERSAYDFLQDATDGSEGTYKLVKGQDYTITKYEHNKLASDHARIWIKGKGNFQGKKSFPFVIEPADLGKAHVKVADQLYTGEAITPVPSEVMLIDRHGHYTVKIEEGQDYVVDPDGYKNNTNVGKATLRLKPVNDCGWISGSIETDFNIVQVDLSKATVKAVPDQTYTGADITPALAVSTGEGELVQDRDYTVLWADNRNVGTARATIKAKSAGCKGEQTITFKIVKRSATITVNNASKAQGEADPIFTGSVEGLAAAGDLGKVEYVRTNTDEVPGVYKGVLDATYRENPNYEVSVTKGDFTITKPNYFVRFDACVPASASTQVVGKMDDQRFAYDEKKALSANGYSLPGYDFTGWNTKADGTGMAYADGAEVRGLSEEGGTVVLYAQWSALPYQIVFNPGAIGGNEHVQTAYFDQPGKLDAYSDEAFGWNSGGRTLHGWAGTGFGSFYGDGADFCNLCGEPRADGSLADKQLTAEWVQGGQIIVTVTKDGVPQDGLADRLVLADEGGTTYSIPVSYENGKYVFDPSAASTPSGGSGQLAPDEYELSFEAFGYPTAFASITYGKESATSVVFTYYTISLAKDPTYPDSHEISISGGEPTGAPNTVVALDGAMLKIKTTVDLGYRFDGYTAVGVTPKWEGDDPSKAEQTIEVQGAAAIAAHVSAIEYAVTVEGGTSDVAKAKLGDTVAIMADEPEPGHSFVQWSGPEDVDFASADASATTFAMPAHDVTVTAVFVPIVIEPIVDKVYTGSPIEPADEVKVSLDGVDLIVGQYDIAFSNNVDKGTATATVTLKKPLAGSATTTFEILPASISGANVSAADQVYDGTEHEPSPTVTWNGKALIEGKDYEVTAYANNVHAGVANVTVTGKGNFSGTTSGAFEIARRQATIKVDDASKVEGKPDPAFIGIVEGLVDAADLGEVKYIRTNDSETPGTYVGVLDAEFTANDNYNVSVEKGSFTIKAVLTLRWLNGDGSVLQVKTYVEGDKPPSYDGDRPTKAATAQYSYAFSGWDAGTVDGATTTYRPLFDKSVNKYTVKFVNDDGAELQSGSLPYGSMPKYTGKTPTKKSTAQYIYKFKGWKPKIVAVRGDATYTATYTATPVPTPPKKGRLTFDFAGGKIDGKSSLTIEANVGDVIVMPKAPVREGYTFKYWKGSKYYPGDKYTVKGDHAFTAVWEKKSNGGGSNGGGNGGGGGGDAKGTGTPDASLRGSSPNTADTLGGAVAALIVASVATLCLVIFALHRQRKRTSAHTGRRGEQR